MVEVRKILVPLDMSSVSPEIIPWAETFAAKLGADLHILFVARAFEHYAGIGVPLPYIDDLEGAIKQEGERRLKEFLDQHFPGQKCLWSVLSGHPAEKIVEFAKNEDVDLIIMGTHGRRGLDRIVFGSVAEYVVKNAPVPVLTINPYR